MPVRQEIPDERIDPLTLENRLGETVTNGDIESRLLRCESVIERANADRCWIRCRQAERGECSELCEGG